VQATTPANVPGYIHPGSHPPDMDEKQAKVWPKKQKAGWIFGSRACIALQAADTLLET
jgi:hypothetical protein